MDTFSLETFTIEAWIRNPGLANGEGIIGYRNGSTSRIRFQVLNNSLALDIGFGGGDTTRVSDTLTWDTDTWYHVAASYGSNTAAANDSVVRLFRDAESTYNPGNWTQIKEFTNVDDLNPLVAGGVLALGGFDNHGGRVLAGDVDEIRWSNFAAVPEPSSMIMSLLGLGGVPWLVQERSR